MFVCAQAARGLLKQMQAEGQRPTPVTFNTMLRGYARRGRAGRQVSLCLFWLLCTACAVQL